nr:hypothetical protein CFP56_10977 [Quercus suber]
MGLEPTTFRYDYDEASIPIDMTIGGGRSTIEPTGRIENSDTARTHCDSSNRNLDCIYLLSHNIQLLFCDDKYEAIRGTDIRTMCQKRVLR